MAIPVPHPHPDNNYNEIVRYSELAVFACSFFVQSFNVFILLLLLLLLLLYYYYWFDSRLYSRKFSGSIGSGTGSTHPSEDNWLAT